MLIGDIKESVEIIEYNAELTKFIINDDIGLDREIKGYDKFYFMGYLIDKTVNVSEDKLKQYKHISIIPTGSTLKIIYIAKNRSYANNLGKIIKNCVNSVEKIGFKLKGLDLKFMEVVYKTQGYNDLYNTVINLYKSNKMPYLFQYTDEKNRYWKNGNIITFVRKGRKEGIENYYVSYDRIFTVHGYYTNEGEARLEIQITRINFRIFPIFKRN